MTICANVIESTAVNFAKLHHWLLCYIHKHHPASITTAFTGSAFNRPAPMTTCASAHQVIQVNS